MKLEDAAALVYANTGWGDGGQLADPAQPQATSGIAPVPGGWLQKIITILMQLLGGGCLPPVAMRRRMARMGLLEQRAVARTVAAHEANPAVQSDLESAVAASARQVAGALTGLQDVADLMNQAQGN